MESNKFKIVWLFINGKDLIIFVKLIFEILQLLEFLICLFFQHAFKHNFLFF